MTLPGASAGLDYLFNPDFSKITGKAIAAALGQAFFSLSLGFGTIMTYASYVSKQENIMFQSAATAVSDLMFAMIAGMAIMPAVFAFGLNPQSGPGLVFETLPFVFGQMPAGGVVAILFFLALLVAALTSSISMLEVAVAYLVEEKKFSRLWACVVLFAVCWVVGAVCSLSFGPLSDIKIDGGNIFDFFDNLSSNILMTLGSLLTVLFVAGASRRPMSTTNSPTAAPSAEMQSFSASCGSSSATSALSPSLRSSSPASFSPICEISNLLIYNNI